MSVFVPLNTVRATSGALEPNAPDHAGTVRYLLVNPPLTDPTAPYHSLSYLVGAARWAGFRSGRCLDANIDALNFLAQRAQVADLLKTAAEVREASERGANALTRRGELRYRAALSAVGLSDDFMQRAIQVFRDPALFYDYPTYRQAVLACRRWLELLSLRGTPAMFEGFGLRPRGPWNHASHRDLTNPMVLNELTGPFDPYLTGPFADLLEGDPWNLIGFSVNYLSQLPFALRMASEARRLCPNAVIVFGGTEVCDDVKFARRPEGIWELFKDADLIVPGEGESAFVAILSAVRDDRDPGTSPGVMRRGDSATPRLVYENLTTLPPPAYDIWDWPTYWSPEPIILYSPTRGCYWNRCTFCDYGLNSDRPTSPSRERPAPAVIEDLAVVNDTIGKVVYFAVDAMSPRYLRSLSSALAESDVNISWSAELRLERTFPLRGIGKDLARAGCVAVSFGYESGSQRILDAIDKGVKIENVAGILQELGHAGIGAQIMGFTGFPTESPEEACETYQFLDRHQDLWTTAGIGTFVLTRGAIVARQPERFGIELLDPPPSDDIVRFVPWRDVATGEPHFPGEKDARVPPDLRQRVFRWPDERPYVGGIDSGHSILYFARYGRDLVPSTSAERPAIQIVSARRYDTTFPQLVRFTSIADLEDWYAVLQANGGPRHDAFRSWLDETGEASMVRSVSTVSVLASGVAVPAPSEDMSSPAKALMGRLTAFHGAA